MNKKQLYESIMKMVSHEVKKALNENVNESLADFRQKYGKKEKTEKIAKTYDEVMEICKPFFADKTFLKVCVYTKYQKLIPLSFNITGKDFCEKYLNDNFQKALFIFSDDRAYVEYAKATESKNELKYINGKDKCFEFRLLPDNKTGCLEINIDYLSNAE